MHALRGDRAARGVFAVAILAAHVLFIWLLSVGYRLHTAPAASSGESIAFLLPGGSNRESVAPTPPEPVQQLFVRPAMRGAQKQEFRVGRDRKRLLF